MNELMVVTHQDLQNYGCPHCGSFNGFTFLSGHGGFYSWSCEHCLDDCFAVQLSISEVDNITFKNTRILNMVGNHPFSPDQMHQILQSGIFLKPDSYPDQQIYQA